MSDTDLALTVRLTRYDSETAGRLVPSDCDAARTDRKDSSSTTGVDCTADADSVGRLVDAIINDADVSRCPRRLLLRKVEPRGVAFRGYVHQRGGVSGKE